MARRCLLITLPPLEDPDVSFILFELLRAHVCARPVSWPVSSTPSGSHVSCRRPRSVVAKTSSTLLRGSMSALCAILPEATEASTGRCKRLD